MKVKSYGGIPLFRSDGEPLGIIVALGCKPMKPADKERIISLMQIFSSRVSSELERKKSEKTIKNSEAKLRIQKTALEKKNISFKELIKHIDEEKNKLKEDITININRTLMPVITELEKSEDPHKYIGLLKLHLEDMQSAFGRRITDGNYNLTAREVEISNLIKGGARSKDICNLLNISYETVEKHRKNIRKKLGISNKKVNLFYFLQKLQ
jgi:DNA-binding CsgD family transcriptional regulator